VPFDCLFFPCSVVDNARLAGCKIAVESIYVCVVRFLVFKQRGVRWPTYKLDKNVLTAGQRAARNDFVTIQWFTTRHTRDNIPQVFMNTRTMVRLGMLTVGYARRGGGNFVALFGRPTCPKSHKSEKASGASTVKSLSIHSNHGSRWSCAFWGSLCQPTPSFSNIKPSSLKPSKYPVIPVMPMSNSSGCRQDRRSSGYTKVLHHYSTLRIKRITRLTVWKEQQQVHNVTKEVYTPKNNVLVNYADFS